MTARLIHWYEVVAGAILSLLGFTGCESILDIVEPRAEYGMPHANYQIVGTVTEEETGNPVEGIKVTFKVLDSPRATFITDKNGKIDESLIEWPEGENLKFIFEDIDGPENGGQFQKDSLERKDFQVEFKEDKLSGWHRGDYNISFEAKLKKQ